MASAFSSCGGDMDGLEKIDEKVRLWAGELIVRAEGKRPPHSGNAASSIIRASISAGRMKGGTQVLAIAIMFLPPEERMRVVDEISEVSPGLFNRIMNYLRGGMGSAIRHDIIMMLFNRAWHNVLLDICSNERVERVSLAMENAGYQ